MKKTRCIIYAFLLALFIFSSQTVTTNVPAGDIIDIT